MWTLAQPNKKRYTQIYADVSSPLQAVKKYIYVMYVTGYIPRRPLFLLVISFE